MNTLLVLASLVLASAPRSAVAQVEPVTILDSLIVACPGVLKTPQSDCGKKGRGR